MLSLIVKIIVVYRERLKAYETDNELDLAHGLAKFMFSISP